MSKQHFDAHDDVVVPAAPKAPKVLITIVVVIGLALMIAVSMRNQPENPKKETPIVTQDDQTKKAADATPEPAPAAAPAPKPTKREAPTAAEVAAAKAAGIQHATLVTDKGTIEVELNGTEAPLTVANFVKLAKSKFYDGLMFHRVEPNFVIQGGDPSGDGTGGPGYSIKLEIAPHIKHVEGALAMARSSNPDSAGSQFYITLAATPFLDKQYAVFGKVTKGMDVVKNIARYDVIKSITVH